MYQDASSIATAQTRTPEDAQAMLHTVSSRVTLAEPIKMEPGTINLSGANSFGPSSPVKLKRAANDEAGADKNNEEAKEGDEDNNDGDDDDNNDEEDNEDNESKEGSEENDDEEDEDNEDEKDDDKL